MTPAKRKRGRPSLKQGEVSVAVKVTFPESDFDRICRCARKRSHIEDRDVSLSEEVRSRMAAPVDESIFGPDDGVAPMADRVVKSGIEYLQHLQSCERSQWIRIVQELLCYLDIATSSHSQSEQLIQMTKDAVADTKEGLALFSYEVPDDPRIAFMRTFRRPGEYMSVCPIKDFSSWPWKLIIPDPKIQ